SQRYWLCDIIGTMKFLSRFLFSIFSNLLAFLIAIKFVEGFTIADGSTTLFGISVPVLVAVVALFTVINLFIRPIIKLILSPIIILTFGLGILVVNALMLYLLDYFSKNVTIQGLEPLAYATLIISVVNLIIGVSARKTYKD
ncbi:MAG: putative membrane protein, partial [Candidatus Wolfebacteria bacterium GW2011_GWC2_46_275]